MKETLQITKEIFTNFSIMNKLALNELVVKNKGNILGTLWLWINPAFQILIYAVVFGSGLRGNAPVEGINFFFWLLPGFVVWLFINSVVTPASRSIVVKVNMITKMKFPVSVMPGVTVLSELYIHLLMLITAIIIIIAFGFSINVNWFYLIYFIFATTCFLFALSLFNSAITLLIKDYRHVVYNSMRTLFFITPVLFPINTMKGELMKVIMKLNPFTYLLEGYRDSLVFSRRTTFLSFKWGVYFWAIVLLMYIIGCILQVKMRKNLLDYA